MKKKYTLDEYIENKIYLLKKEDKSNMKVGLFAILGFLGLGIILFFFTTDFSTVEKIMLIIPIAAVIIIGLFSITIVAVMKIIEPGMVGADHPLIAILGLLFLGGGCASLVGLFCGIFGAFKKNKKKMFSILGVIFNGIILCCFLLLMFFAIIRRV